MFSGLTYMGLHIADRLMPTYCRYHIERYDDGDDVTLELSDWQHLSLRPANIFLSSADSILDAIF